MSRDYAKNRRKPTRKSRNRSAARRPRSNAPGWVWLFCGLCIGLVVAAGVYVFGRPSGSGGVQIAGVPGAVQIPDAAADAGQAKPLEPRFAFYEMLPNYEVVIPEEEYTEETGPSQTTTPKVAEPGRYVIQAGSFSTYDDADRRKAGLALLGVESTIEKVELDDGRVFFRVRTLPVNALDRLNDVLKLLRENSIDTLVMRYDG